MPQPFRFVVGDVFPADQILSEWIATLALAFNDIALVHREMVAKGDSPHEFLYWLRLAISHFSEAAEYLEATKDIPEVAAFVASLSLTTQQNYQACLTLYTNREKEIQQIRNLAAFHYPELKRNRRNRPMRWALRELAREPGQIRGGKIIEGRMLFADDIVSKLFVRSTPGWNDVATLSKDIGDGVTAFMRFANGAIERFLMLAVKRGVKISPYWSGSG